MKKNTNICESGTRKAEIAQTQNSVRRGSKLKTQTEVISLPLKLGFTRD